MKMIHSTSHGKEKAEGLGVSEVIGTFILMAVVMAGMVTVALILFSQPPPSKVPAFNAIITNQSNNIFIKHKGGDALMAGEYRILVDGTDMTSSFTSTGDEPWSIGETLYATVPSIPSSVAIVLNQSSGDSILLLASNLVGIRKVPEPSSIEWYNFGATGRCDWAYRKSITIDSSKIPADQSDFPVLISLASDPELAASARADGNGIVFTASDGTTKLSHEIESFTKDTGALVAWVKVPALSSSEDTVLWMYYGNVGSDNQQDPENVWDASYMAVWHHNTNFLDSTSNNNDGTNSQSVNVAAKIANAQQYDGSNDYVNAGSAASIDNIFGTGGTFSAWIYPYSIGENSEGMVGSKASGTTGQTGWSFATNTNNVLMFRKAFGTTRGYWRTPSDSITLDAWNYVAVTYNQASRFNDPTIYINSVSQGITEVQTPAGAVQSDASNSLRLGNYGTSRTFDGIIDEIRASNTIRNPEWIETEYNNQNNPAAFSSLGTEEEWWKC
jgi:Concanavalin A-like lectin/glucanases superfamily/Domain of unknown function (DUF2341)/Archaeal Type IV pilin, N-terminal